ncbi:MAG: ASKHA domain-containing protein [Dehalococcoidia bacterium]
MNKYKVMFLPDQKEAEVDEGASLFEAAEKVGVYLNSLCAGEGVCGKCRVQVIKGNLKADKNAIAFFTKEEIKNGYVLACQSIVNDNLEVLVPPESRLEEEQIMIESRLEGQKEWQKTTPITYSQPEWVAVAKRPYEPASYFEPLVTKLYLELPEPTSEDNIPDTGRMTLELKKKLRYPYYEVPLSCLRDLSVKLRRSRWKVTVTVASHNEIGKILQIEEGNTTDKNYAVAVDVGTTTVVAQLVSLKTGQVMGVEGNHNLQARYGEDVLSRIAYVCGKGSTDALQKVVVENINTLIQSLAQKKSINVQDITCIVAAGNTTMSHLLLGLSPCSIRDDPYVPTVDIYPQIQARELGIDINPYGLVWVMPNVASYVGGDTVAGILACGLADKPEMTCLIDIGTNGEIVIGNNEWMLSCSASAGPAFEGGDMKCGMRATRGAIQKVEINDGEVNYETISNAKPRGICGSALIDVIYELTRNRIIDIDARFNPALKDKRLIQGEGEMEYMSLLSPRKRRQVSH